MFILVLDFWRGQVLVTVTIEMMNDIFLVYVDLPCCMDYCQNFLLQSYCIHLQYNIKTTVDFLVQ